PWGMFGAPQEYDPSDPDSAKNVAVSARLLGASWKRMIYSYPAFDDQKFTIQQGPPLSVVIDLDDQLKYARALRDQGIFLIADLQRVPRLFSSKPEDNSVIGDSGFGYSLVPPRDYELWEQFAQALGSRYRGLVQVWEIGNEPD